MRIIRCHVGQDLPLGFIVDARGKVVQQQDARIKRQGARQHDALLLPAGEAGPALGNDGVEFFGQGVNVFPELGGGDRLFQTRVFDRVAEGDVLAQAQIEHDAVLENEADLIGQTLLVVAGERLTVVEHLALRRVDEPGQRVEELCLAGGRRADDRNFAAGRDRKRHVLERGLFGEAQRQVPRLDRAGKAGR